MFGLRRGLCRPCSRRLQPGPTEPHGELRPRGQELNIVLDKTLFRGRRSPAAAPAKGYDHPGPDYDRPPDDDHSRAQDGGNGGGYHGGGHDDRSPSCAGRLLAPAVTAPDYGTAPNHDDGPGDHDVVGHHDHERLANYNCRDDVDRSVNHYDGAGNGNDRPDLNDDERATRGGDRTDAKLVRVRRYHGPYIEVTGTFTVPYLTSSATCNEENALWAGIDGFNQVSLPFDSDLIQAGISEGMTNPATGRCSPGTFYVWPWWEILPASETLIAAWGDGAMASVNAGDQVTVTIGEVSATMWSISLVDDTTGGSFTTEQAFSAPESSGEWVMEAVDNTGLCQGTCQLPPYCAMSGGECSAPVPFSNLGATGDQSTLWDITMVQNGVAVSTPSSFSNNGFSVAYTGTEAAPAGPSAGAGSLLQSGGSPRKLASPIYSRSPDAFSSRHLPAEKEDPAHPR